MKKNKTNPTRESQSAKVEAIAARLRGRREPAVPFPSPDEVLAESAGRTESAILKRYEWKEVHAPKTWYPKIPGEELVGFYGGRTTRNGSHGQYDVVLVHVPAKGSYMASGTKLMQLVDAAMIEIGHPIRIVWEGHQNLGTAPNGEEKRMKLFRVLVAEGEPIDAADLPRVSQ